MNALGKAPAFWMEVVNVMKDSLDLTVQVCTHCQMIKRSKAPAGVIHSAGETDQRV